MAVIEVAIGPGGGPGKFRVEVIDSPAGHLSGTARLDAESLTARHGLLQQEVLASSVRARGVPETERFLREAGQALFSGLLGADRIAGCYQVSAALAAERDEDLRVVLRIDDPVLAGLPWEAMFDEEAGAYVCRRDQLVRHIPVASVPAPLQVRPPLRILGVASSPRGLPWLDADKEKDYLARALARLTGHGLAEVRWAPAATWAGLQDLLMDGEWHVVHYVGHGDFDHARDEGVLALEREDGRADLVSARRLVDLLRQARPMPRLVVLNSCAGAATGTGDLFSGTAAALVRGGVPAVTAMQYKITDDAAIAFARGFYAALARGRGIDDAVSSGRTAILGTSDHTLEWVTPVLYLRGNQARLFTLPAPASTSVPGLAAAGRSAFHADTTAEPSHDRTLTGHADTIEDVAFSPDWQRLATGSDDKTARVWDLATGRCLHTLTGHSNGVTNVAFSPDGQLLATTDSGVKGWTPLPGGAARIWDTATGRCLHTLSGSADSTMFEAFSPDGRLLATTDSDFGETVRVWDAATGRCLHAFTGNTDMAGNAKRVTSVAFSPDGRLLATTESLQLRAAATARAWERDSGTARVWDLATGRCLQTLTGHTYIVSKVVFSPDGELLATASWDRTARVWDAATGRCLQILTGHTGGVVFMAFSPDGRLLATTGTDSDDAVGVWHAATGRCLYTLTGRTDTRWGVARPDGRHTGTHWDVAFSPDGRLLLTKADSQYADHPEVRIWDAATGRCLQTLEGLTGRVKRMAFTPDGRLLGIAKLSDAAGHSSGADLTLTVAGVARDAG